MSQSLITWNDQSKSWLTDASSFTGFHKLLAQKVLPHTTRSDVICDVGCGLGRLDFELAPYVSEIHAVDVSQYAINSVKNEAELTGLKNLHARNGDAAELDGDFDVILLSFFGKTDFSMFLSHCRRVLIRIVSASRKSGLYPERHRREVKDAVPIVKDELRALGIEYDLELCSFEFGQPLRTWSDAQQFVLSNAPNAGADEVDTFLNDNAQLTGRADFPYYLPYKKELGIFIIDKESNEGISHVQTR